MAQSHSPSSNSIGLDAYQEMAVATAIYPNNARVILNNGDTVAIYPFLGLCEEAGECAGKVKKVLRDSDGLVTEERRLELMHELGDTLWYLANCANELGYPLSYIARMNIQKLHDRKQRNTLQGDGDNR